LLGDDAAFGEDVEGGFIAAARFAEYAPNIALKCGADGCILASPGGSRHIPGVKAEKVVDTTGAGDCWNGSFLFHLQRSTSPADAAAAANRQAAAKLAYRG